jgi:molybdopterin converting factor small subunit
MVVEVRLYATLRRHAPQGAGGIMKITVSEQSTVEEVLRDLGVDLEEVKLIMVNGLSAELGAVLAEGDRLGIFPPVGGG